MYTIHSALFVCIVRFMYVQLTMCLSSVMILHYYALIMSFTILNRCILSVYFVNTLLCIAVIHLDVTMCFLCANASECFNVFILVFLCKICVLCIVCIICIICMVCVVCTLNLTKLACTLCVLCVLCMINSLLVIFVA